MIPKLSAPLVKDIRTGEGILEWLLAAGVTVAGATSNLSVSHTAAYVAIVAAIKGGRRALLKLVALTRPSLGAPIAPTWTATNLSTTPGTVALSPTVGGATRFTLPSDAPVAPAAPVDEPSPITWEPEHGLAPEPPAVPDPAVPA